MRLKIRLTPGILFILVTFFAVVYGKLIYDVSNEYHEKAAQLSELKEQYNQLVQENIACERELRYVQSDEGIQLYAHMYGYQFADETCFTAVEVSN